MIEDCPTTKCWEIRNDKCSLKASCNTLLTCTPDSVDFRRGSEALYQVVFLSTNIEERYKNSLCHIYFRISYSRYNHADLFGAGNIHDQIPQSRDDCPPQAFAGADGRDKQWLGPLGSCNSGCEKTAENKLKVTKKFKYASTEYTGDDLGDAKIFLNVKNTIEVEIACLFETTFTATSDQIELRDESFLHEGKLEVEGSWKDSLSIKYMLPAYSGEVPEGYVHTLGKLFRSLS